MSAVIDIERMRRASKALRTCYIAHPAAVAAANRIELLHQRRGIGAEAESVALVGPSRSGKTSLLKRHIAHHPADLTADVQRRPVLYVSVPALCTLKNLAAVMLAQLGDRYPSRGTFGSLVHRVESHLEGQSVEMVIFDEFQHLIDRKSQRIQYEAADWIKTMLNNPQRPVVLAGLPEALDVLRANVQQDLRTSEILRLAGLSWKDQGDRTVFRSILDAFDKGLVRAGAMSRKSGLASAEASKRIHLATRGLVGSIVRLLTAAAIRAVEDRASRIERPHLSDAFNGFSLVDDPDEAANPFNR